MSICQDIGCVFPWKAISPLWYNFHLENSDMARCPGPNPNCSSFPGNFCSLKGSNLIQCQSQPQVKKGEGDHFAAVIRTGKPGKPGTKPHGVILWHPQQHICWEVNVPQQSSAKGKEEEELHILLTLCRNFTHKHSLSQKKKPMPPLQGNCLRQLTK